MESGLSSLASTSAELNDTRGYAHPDGEEGDGLVHPPKRRDIDSLTSDGTLRPDTGRVFSRSGVYDGVDYRVEGEASSETNVLDGKEAETYVGSEENR